MRAPIFSKLLLTFSLILCLFILSSSMTKRVQAEGGPVQVGYLVDENFSFLLKTPDNRHLASGWDIELNGGIVTYSYNNYLKISDTSSTLPVTMYRKFVAQTSDTVTLEFRFKPLTVIDGLQWQLRSDTSAAVSITTSNNQLVLNTSSGTINLGTYSANVEYGVKVIANIDTDKTDVYVNGVLKASAADFNQAVSKLNGFWTSTGSTSTGDIHFTPVKVYKGYAVNETFISTMTNVPDDWQSTTIGGVVAVEENRSSTRPDIYSLKLDGSSSTNGVSAFKLVPAQMENQIFEFKMLIPVKADGMIFELKSGDKSAIKLSTVDGQLSYINRGGKPVTFYEYKENLWYAIKVKINPSKDKADIYLNGKLLVRKIPITKKVDHIDSLSFYAPSGSDKVMWVDDIKLYQDYPLPSDYVPAPENIPSSDYEVGVQSCSMWREGSHLGWDTINPYPERAPLLGFYDEGSPETADWEIKWKVEHGISFETYCWFRPRGNEGLPIKDPYLGHALHDGYFNAEYSDQMSFTIMWENVSSFLSDSDRVADFENNLVPYWIEYYFKDPRYLKIDNKPVLSIYNLNELIADFGSIAGVKTEVDYLRSAVQAAGFSDIILLTPTNRSDFTTLNNIVAAGFDSIYAYTYGGIGSRIGMQQETMLKQKNAGMIDVITSLSMGRDDIPWRGTSGYWTSDTEFNDLTQWAKNTFIPSLPSDSVGKKMIMLDNWNEYGEGHFLLPTGLNGFGYLDSIRSAFTSGGAHIDGIPTQVQKDRINVLYPSDRIVQPVFTRPEITNNYSVSWEFDTDDNSEGWTEVKQIDNLTVAGGSYSGSAIDIDPGIVSGDMIQLPAAEASYLQIRMSSSKETVGQIYFITNADTNWAEDKSIQFYIGKTDDEQIVYNIPMFESATWKGMIRQIRVDMSTSPADFSIDYIRGVDSTGNLDSISQITDPGFEDSVTHYSGWSITQLLTTSEFRSGSQSVQINKSNAYGSIQFPIAIAKGDTYNYSAWAKLAPGATAGQVLRLGLQYKLDGVQKQVIILTGTALSTSAWNQVKGNYTIMEAGLVTDVTLLIYTDIPAKAESYYLDDVNVRKVL